MSKTLEPTPKVDTTWKIIQQTQVKDLLVSLVRLPDFRGSAFYELAVLTPDSQDVFMRRYNLDAEGLRSALEDKSRCVFVAEQINGDALEFRKAIKS